MIINKNISILLILIVVSIGNAFSAPPVNKCQINGIVIDSITGEGLPFASVQMFLQQDSVFVKGAITNINGNYTIKTTLQTAIQESFNYAKKENIKTILFSPGCASFDMFKNVYDRIEQFTKLIENLK